MGMNANPAWWSRPLPLGVDSGLTFAAPWEAKAFAIVVSLSQAGHFTWAEWVACFSHEVALAGDVEPGAEPGLPGSYYEQWLNAAETLLASKGLLTSEQLQARRFAIAVAGTGNTRPWPTDRS